MYLIAKSEYIDLSPITIYLQALHALSFPIMSSLIMRFFTS